MIVLLGSWTSIALLTTLSSKIEEYMKKSFPSLGFIASQIVPLSVIVINSILPKLIEALMKLDPYDSQGDAVRILVLRTFIAKTFNVALMSLSLLLLSDPVMFTQVSEKHGVWVIGRRSLCIALGVSLTVHRSIYTFSLV